MTRNKRSAEEIVSDVPEVEFVISYALFITTIDYPIPQFCSLTLFSF